MNQAEAATLSSRAEPRTSTTREEPSAEPSEAQLLDVLYEVLAQGVPAKGSLRTEDVERFLHEHARNKKTIAQMLEFFTKHKLPVSAAQYGADPELGELASGLHKDRLGSHAFAPVEAEDTGRRASASESGPVLKLPTQDTSRTRRPVEIVVAAPEPPKHAGLLPKLAFGLSAALSAALVLTVLHAQSLSQDLEKARLQQRSTDSALSALETRSEMLQSSLAGSENERRALSDRFDSFVVGEAQKRAAEEVALERILGPRFEALRNKALQEAYLAAP